MRQTSTPTGPPPEAAVMDYETVSDLAAVREFVCARALAAGLPQERVSALRLAVSEIATNTLRHTSAGGTARVWSDARAVFAEFTDYGTVPRLKAGQGHEPGAPGGWGLRIAAEVCDEFYCFSQPGRTVWRLVVTG